MEVGKNIYFLNHKLIFKYLLVTINLYLATIQKTTSRLKVAQSPYG